jgi:hypothetical protein
VSLIGLYPTLVDLCGLDPPGRLDGRSLRPLVADPAAPWDHPAVTTVGRGTYSIRSDTHRYILYSDGSEELYDLRADPREWHNLADDPRQAAVKKALSKAIPSDDHVAHFVRMDRWKAVFFTDPARKPLLYHLGPGTGAGGGIGETKNLADEHPDILEKIQTALDRQNIKVKRVTIP